MANGAVLRSRTLLRAEQHRTPIIVLGAETYPDRGETLAVTNENKPISGWLLVGDEILSVNGIECNSRRNAIQMVGTIDDELHLEIYRWNTNSDIQSNSANDPSSPRVYNNMVETMNDLSQSYYSLKRNSIQNKNHNNNDKVVTSTAKYNVKPSTTLVKRISSEDMNRGADEDSQPQHGLNKISPSHQRTQKVTVKMVPVATKTNATIHSNSSSKIVAPTSIPHETDIDETDAVDHESVQKVSKARAMFESMSSVKSAQPRKTSSTRPKLKTWNSGGSLLDDREGERRWSPQPRDDNEHDDHNNRLQPLPPPVHKHSRSLPIEIVGQEFAAAYAAYRQQPNTFTVAEDATHVERPKSAYSYSEQMSGADASVPTVPQRYSQSDMLRNYRSRSSYGQGDQSGEMTSRSTENLLSMQEKRMSLGGSTSPSGGGTKDSANELRQAASRYHQELMKNYPKFRHSISGKDIGPQKYPRKMSDDNFSRGEPLRATIATTSNARVPRSHSIDTPGWSFDGENSMMSRLLQGQSAASLMKIDEEAKNRMKKESTENSQPLIRSNSLGGDTPYRKASLELVMRTIPVDTGTEDTTDKPESRHTTDVRSSPETKEHCSNQRSVVERDPTVNSEEPLTDLHNNSSFENDFAPATLADADATIDDLVLPTHSDVQQQVAVTSHLVNVDNKNYVHRKESSTDSAVYVNKDNISMIDHQNTDSMNELNSINMSALQLNHDEDESFPPPPDDMLLSNEGSNIEREKPQRTINRKKKDSGLPVSRNSSCVSTDSTTSTVDSGIFVRLDSSPRTSPISSNQYYNNKDLTASRENLDDEVRALEEENRRAGTSIDRSHSYDGSFNGDAGVNDDSMTGNTNLEDLDTEKTKLIDSMREKINELREQEQEISDEINMNEDLGKKVLGMVETKATQSEFSKYELFIGELNKIVALLLSLTQRLHRYEMMLQDLDMSNESDKLKKDGLISKIDKLKSQHEEACYLRDVNDKRGDNVAIFLEKYCSEEEFADFQYYVDMKSQLALMQSEIREKVKLGEERLKALEQTGSDWGIG